MYHSDISCHVQAQEKESLFGILARSQLIDLLATLSFLRNVKKFLAMERSHRMERQSMLPMQ